MVTICPGVFLLFLFTYFHPRVFVFRGLQNALTSSMLLNPHYDAVKWVFPPPILGGGCFFVFCFLFFFLMWKPEIRSQSHTSSKENVPEELILTTLRSSDCRLGWWNVHLLGGWPLSVLVRLRSRDLQSLGPLVPHRVCVPCPQEIAAMIDTEFAKQTSLDAVAQAVVDRVKRIHSDTFASGGERAKFCPRHEDMTLLVRNFGYPLGELSQPTPAPAPGMWPRAREDARGCRPGLAWGGAAEAVGLAACGGVESGGLARSSSRQGPDSKLPELH